MAARVQVQCPQDYASCESQLKRAVLIVLAQHSARAKASLTVVITDNETLRQLNRRHREINAPTDVLSYPAPKLPASIASEGEHLGDVLIAYDYVVSQARARGTSLEDTLCLLVIHGTLHLLGYRHDTDEECEKMWLAQANALERLGICNSIVDRYETIKNE